MASEEYINVDDCDLDICEKAHPSNPRFPYTNSELIGALREEGVKIWRVRCNFNGILFVAK